MRTYIFAANMVYENYRKNGLQQRSIFYINDIFPNGPHHVNAAFTNRISGVTILISYKTVYRYVWNNQLKQFNVS